MNWYKKASDEDYQEMRDWFEKRTNKHIDAVKKFCKKIVAYDSERFEKLMDQVEDHDQTKFKDPEIEPYIYVTWSYKCKDDGVDWEPPEGMDDKMNEATTHHVLNNRHHPEFHAGEDSDVINKEDRDNPVRDKVIDGTEMPDLDIAEMVADWCAVSEERGNSPKSWADKNVNVRWKFTDDQKDLIYELIKEIWA
jgi:hypothetical protein